MWARPSTVQAPPFPAWAARLRRKDTGSPVWPQTLHRQLLSMVGVPASSVRLLKAREGVRPETAAG